MSKRKQPKPKPKVEHTPQEGLWVRGEISLEDGSYQVGISFDADTSWVLDRDQANRYAVSALSSAQRAEYDGSVFLLFTQRMKLSALHAAEFIGTALRPSRPRLDHAATAPLAFVPGVTSVGKVFITILNDDRPVGQISPDQLRDHAMAVLENLEAAILDTQLAKILQEEMDLPEHTARQVIMDLANYHPKQED